LFFSKIPATGKAGKCGVLCGGGVSGPKERWGTQKTTNESGRGLRQGKDSNPRKE